MWLLKDWLFWSYIGFMFALPWLLPYLPPKRRKNGN